MGIVNISGQSVEKGSQYGDSKYKWSVKISNFIATLIFKGVINKKDICSKFSICLNG
jgi:hypothetical protein